MRAAAIRSGRAYIEFRDLPGAEVEPIKKQQEVSATGWGGNRAQQYHQAVHRCPSPQALTLGLDRYTGGRVLLPLTGLRDVGGLMRPGTEWALPQAELDKLPGFGATWRKPGPRPGDY